MTKKTRSKTVVPAAKPKAEPKVEVPADHLKTKPKAEPKAEVPADRSSDIAAAADAIRGRHRAGHSMMTPAVAQIVLLLRIIEILEEEGSRVQVGAAPRGRPMSGQAQGTTTDTGQAQGPAPTDPRRTGHRPLKNEQSE